MTRKDSEKDSERPHYYSQFWLDVAAGRRVIGTPKEATEAEVQEPATAAYTAGRADQDSLRQARAAANGDINDYETSEAELAAEEEEEFIAPEEEEFTEIEEFNQEDQEEDEGIPDVDLNEIEEERLEENEEEEDFYDEGEEDEEEEDEEDIGWGGRGRKKPKPGRTTRPPQRKPGKRDTRRSY